MKEFGRQPADTETGPAVFIVCPGCQAKAPAGQKFCGSCGQSIEPERVKCVKSNFNDNYWMGLVLAFLTLGKK
ncbi:hypothetical protein DCMF_05295 [Candidatus Formimonas warabiya]|uniref:Zinc ribbon domain-containing protein n=1 Tax=Formimonas warabiya TaxID=1761012 RepID=A0A3G1KP92_FORW1|nr:hypothetical protein DCMF_05295 [Candidatus Formimonas warabiya]